MFLAATLVGWIYRVNWRHKKIHVHDSIAILWVKHVIICEVNDLMGKDLVCYSDKNESVGLRKCRYDH